MRFSSKTLLRARVQGRKRTIFKTRLGDLAALPLCHQTHRSKVRQTRTRKRKSLAAVRILKRSRRPSYQLPRQATVPVALRHRRHPAIMQWVSHPRQCRLACQLLGEMVKGRNSNRQAKVYSGRKAGQTTAMATRDLCKIHHNNRHNIPAPRPPSRYPLLRATARRLTAWATVIVRGR